MTSQPSDQQNDPNQDTAGPLDRHTLRAYVQGLDGDQVNDLLQQSTSPADAQAVLNAATHAQIQHVADLNYVDDQQTRTAIARDLLDARFPHRHDTAAAADHGQDQQQEHPQGQGRTGWPWQAGHRGPAWDPFLATQAPAVQATAAPHEQLDGATAHDDGGQDAITATTETGQALAVYWHSLSTAERISTYSDLDQATRTALTAALTRQDDEHEAATECNYPGTGLKGEDHAAQDQAEPDADEGPAQDWVLDQASGYFDVLSNLSPSWTAEGPTEGSTDASTDGLAAREAADQGDGAEW